MDAHIPIELNEENVLRIYNDCLMKKKLSNFLSSDVLPVKIFTKESCGKDSPEICFSKSKIEEYSLAIDYMYGQLYEVHHGESMRCKDYQGRDMAYKFLTPDGGMLNYKNQPWTKDRSTLMMFYYLGVASVTIMPFVLYPDKGQIGVDLIYIEPTLSPNDPEFKKIAEAIRLREIIEYEKQRIKKEIAPKYIDSDDPEMRKMAREILGME